MILFKLYLTLAAILCQSHGTPSLDLNDLMTTNPGIQTEIVDKHNELRRIVNPTASNMQKMSWNDNIAASASRAALRCQYKPHSSEAERTVDGVLCGENYYMSSNARTWSHCIQSWFNEVNNFNFGSGPTSPGAMVGHYTQVVWDDSFYVGCACTYCPDQPAYKYFMVCQYSPGGNIQGREYEPYSIGEPCADCPDACDNGLCTNP